MRMSPIRSRNTVLRRWILAALATLVAACGSPPPRTVEPVEPSPAAHTAPPEPQLPPPRASAPIPQRAPDSQARNPKDYRRDAAGHLYQTYADQIYAGKLPALLYAIGVLEVHLDNRGQVTGLHWLRAPKHAPEVVAAIEKKVRDAAPYPRPARLGRVVYTDTWLWDRSGRFQLDTLSEGQH